jgi:protein-tyrosine phosphatase
LQPTDEHRPPQPWVDIHCHCLPGVDDGPATLEGSLELCRQLVTAGVSQVVATPHQLGRYEGRNPARDIRAAVSRLQTELDRAGLPLRVHPGAEVRIDPGVATLLQRDQILSMADGRKYLLLELPLDIAVNPARLIGQLAQQGVQTVIAHAERYPSVVRQPGLALAWVQAGAAIQVNAGSLVGEAGSNVEACAWELVSRGMVSLVASDAHDPVRRKPRIAEAARLLADEIGATPARQLLSENPRSVLEGQPLKPVIAFVDRSAND